MTLVLQCELKTRVATQESYFKIVPKLRIILLLEWTQKVHHIQPFNLKNEPFFSSIELMCSTSGLREKEGSNYFPASRRK